MSELPYLVCVADPDQLVQHIPSPVLNVEKKGPPRKKPKSTPACEQTTMPGAARCGRGVSATVAVQVQVQRGPGGHAQRWIEQSRTTGAGIKRAEEKVFGYVSEAIGPNPGLKRALAHGEHTQPSIY